MAPSQSNQFQFGHLCRILSEGLTDSPSKTVICLNHSSGMTLAPSNAMLRAFLLLAALMVLTVDASASEYDPPNLYDVDHFKLQNGLDVVLKKKRTHAHIAVRNERKREARCTEQ